MLVLLLAGVWAARDNPWLIGAFVSVGVVAAVWFIHKAFAYAEKHPDHAVSEGGELVRLAELAQSTKNAAIIDLAAEPVANTSPPKALASRDSSGGA